MYFNHDSSSPADNDELGQIRYYGDNSNGDSEMFVQVKVNATTVADGSEASKLSFITKTGGSDVNNLILDGGKVGIGIAPTDGLLHVYEGSAGSVTAHANGDELVLESDNSEVGMSILGSTTSNQNILFGDPDDHKKGYITYAHNGDTLILGANAGNVMKLDGNSKISLSNNDSGNSNTVFGKSAAGNIDSNSNYNTFVGENVSDASMNGATSNTAIGYSSASGLTSGDNNVMVGSTAGKDATTSSKSVYVGARAGEGANHNHNTYVGYEAGLVSGNSDNTAVGYLALGSGSNGYSNVAIGREALKNTTGHMAVAVGEGAMQENTTGQYNVAVGWSALRTNVDGDKNTAVGYKSLYTFEADTDGHGGNSALGWESGMDLTTGTQNTFIGENSGGNVTDGDQNTALGSYALAQTIAGSSNNTAIGFYACGAGDITHGEITAVGAYALAENVGGQKNVAVGFQAGNVLTSGSQNTIVGYDADTDDNSATNQTVIGSEVTGVADNSVTLGNASVTAVYMASDSGAVVHCSGVNFPDTPVESADANTLDDYEEGLVTNLAFAFGGNSAGQTYNSSRQQARYTKVGNRVFVGGWIEISDKGSSTGAVTITGLPFTVQDHLAANTGGAIGYMNNISFADFPMLTAPTNTTTLQLYETTNSGATTTLTEANLDTSGGNTVNFMFGFHYNTH